MPITTSFVKSSLIFTLMIILPQTITSVKYMIECTTKVLPADDEEGEPVDTPVYFYQYKAELEHIIEKAGEEDSKPSPTGDTSIQGDVTIVSAAVNPLADEKCDVIVAISRTSYFQYTSLKGEQVFVTSDDYLQMTDFEGIDSEKCKKDDEDLINQVFDSANVLNRPVNKDIPAESLFTCDIVRVDRRLVLV